MTETLQFELVSPERKLASLEAEMVTIPGMLGDLTAMANHAPFLTTLRPGLVVVHNGGKKEAYFLTGGFAEISDNTVTVLAEDAMEHAELSRGFVEERIEAQRKVVDDAGPDHIQPATQKLNDYLAVLAQVDLPAGS